MAWHVGMAWVLRFFVKIPPIESRIWAPLHGDVGSFVPVLPASPAVFFLFFSFLFFPLFLFTNCILLLLLLLRRGFTCRGREEGVT
ncbi:uncharacterized protein J3D65DRAFT_634652 [Phyllosticta citribraziliensis]|uniref:Uncharacterized protein n=1 Tax=Phyllosticta citribraziliensis TaxID=989973 RepID=A0ABR1LD80_9PEZI